MWGAWVSPDSGQSTGKVQGGCQPFWVRGRPPTSSMGRGTLCHMEVLPLCAALLCFTVSMGNIGGTPSSPPLPINWWVGEWARGWVGGWVGEPKSQGGQFTPPPPLRYHWARGPLRLRGRGALRAGVNWGRVGGGSGEQAQRAGPYFPQCQKKMGAEPDLPNLCVESRVSAISDVRRCFWWAWPLGPNQRGAGASGREAQRPPLPGAALGCGP